MTKFVLVHGAWHDTWCWERVIPELRRRGHEATAVSLPKDREAGMQASITAVDSAISTPADTTLVAHSASGLVAPIVAGRRQVSELVLVAALMQVPGYSWVAQREAQKSAQHTEFFLMHEPRILVDAQGNWTWRTEDGAKVFYNDCEPADAVCSQDRAVSRDWAIRTAREQFDATIEEFDASHSPFWSRSADLAELLTRADESLASRK